MIIKQVSSSSSSSSISQPDFTPALRSSGGVQRPRGRTDAHRLADAECRRALLHHHEVATSAAHVTSGLQCCGDESAEPIEAAVGPCCDCEAGDSGVYLRLGGSPGGTWKADD